MKYTLLTSAACGPCQLVKLKIAKDALSIMGYLKFNYGKEVAL